MSKLIINIGSAPQSGDGDTVRAAFDKANKNFTELYAAVGSTSSVAAMARPLGIIRSRSFCHRYWATASPNYTFGSTWAVDDEFDLIRVVHANYGTTPYDVTKTVVGAVGSINAAGNYLPINASGATVPLIPVTYNGGSTTASVPAAVLNGNNANNAVDGLLASDWIACSSIPRQDGGTRPYLHLRTLRGAGAAVKASTLSAEWKDPSVNLGREIATWIKEGDFTDGSAVTSTTSSGWLEQSAIQTYTRNRGATVLAIGDSLTQGVDTTGAIMGWPHVATASIHTERLPVSLVASGRSGSNSASFYERAIREIDLYRPEVVTFPVFTPNDGNSSLTQTVIDTCWTRAMRIVDYAYRAGVTPVLMGTLPWTYSAADDALRLQLEARLTRMREAGSILTLGFDAVISDGATPGRIKASYVGSSGNHPNTAGHAAMAAVAIPVLRRAIGA